MTYALRFCTFCLMLTAVTYSCADDLYEWIDRNLTSSNPEYVSDRNFQDAMEMADKYRDITKMKKAVRNSQTGRLCKVYCTKFACSKDKEMRKLCQEICTERSENEQRMARQCRSVSSKIKSGLGSAARGASEAISTGLEVTGELAEAAGEYRKAVDPHYTGKVSSQSYDPETGEIINYEFDDSLARVGKDARAIKKVKERLEDITKRHSKSFRTSDNYEMTIDDELYGDADTEMMGDYLSEEERTPDVIPARKEDIESKHARRIKAREARKKRMTARRERARKRRAAIDAVENIGTREDDDLTRPRRKEDWQKVVPAKKKSTAKRRMKAFDDEDIFGYNDNDDDSELHIFDEGPKNSRNSPPRRTKYSEPKKHVYVDFSTDKGKVF